MNIERELMGKRIDINRMKYKIHKKKKYLIRVNKLINKLVKIDTKIEGNNPIKPLTKSLQHDPASQKANKGIGTSKKRESETTKGIQKSNPL